MTRWLADSTPRQVLIDRHIDPAWGVRLNIGHHIGDAPFADIPNEPLRCSTFASVRFANLTPQTEPDTCIDRHKYPIKGVRLNIEHPQSNYYQDTCAMIHPGRIMRVPRVMRYDALRFTCASPYRYRLDAALTVLPVIRARNVCRSVR